MNNADDMNLQKIFQDTDGLVEVDAAKLSEKVFAKKRIRNFVAARMLTAGCAAGLIALSIGFLNWDTKAAVEVSQSNVTEANEIELKNDDAVFEYENFRNDGDLESMQQRLLELKAKLKSLQAKRQSQQLAVLKEELSRTKLKELSTEFSELVEF